MLKKKLFLTATTLCCTLAVFAQERPNNRVIIIEKEVNDNGEVRTERKVLEGADAEAIELGEDLQELLDLQTSMT
jgi:hypothetical protein